MNNNRGEISIPMIIIGIVLIIIVGICIFMLTGENGLFVPKTYETENKIQENEIITNNTQNTTENENTALTIPM